MTVALGIDDRCNTTVCIVLRALARPMGWVIDRFEEMRLRGRIAKGSDDVARVGHLDQVPVGAVLVTPDGAIQRNDLGDAMRGVTGELYLRPGAVLDGIIGEGNPIVIRVLDFEQP